jgi:hypothetical protein
MLRRTAGLALALALLLPGAALAADPKPPDPGPTTTVPAGHAYYIAAIEQGGQTAKVEGKLWIAGEELGASVGCNSIGARATFDGRTLTVRSAVVTTEMACPEPQATAERTLLAALNAGSFTWDGSGFAGKGVRIVASEVGVAPPLPPDGGTVEPGSKPGVDPGVIEPEPGMDLEACRRFIPEKEWNAVFGPISGGGGGSGSGNVGSGSGGGATGSGGSAVEPPPVLIFPAPTGGTSRPNQVDPAPPEASPGTVEPVPAATAPTGGTRQTPKPKSEPKPGATGTTTTEPSTASDQPVAVDLPATTADGGTHRLPVGVADRPAPTPSTEACRELLSRIRTMAAPAAAIDAGGGKRESASTRDLAAERTGLLDPIVAMLLVLAGGGFLVAWLRAIPGPRRLP